MSDEYLERGLLPNVSYEITKDKVEVSSPNTAFVKIYRVTPISIKELTDSYTKLKKLSVPKFFKRLPEVTDFIGRHWSAYLKEIELVNLIFENIVVVYREIEKRGIRQGSLDDKVLLLGESLVHKHRNLTGYGTSIGSVTAYRGMVCLGHEEKGIRV